MTNDAMWLVLAVIGLTGVLTIGSALMTGFLVLKAKREAHEPVFGYKQRKGQRKPINIDEFATPDDDTVAADDDTLPESVALQNKIFGSVFAKDNLKGDKGCAK